MSNHKSAIGNRLVDDMADAYDDWHEECALVRNASAQFSIAPGADRAMAFAAYMAALDREERAAESYATFARRATAVSHESKPARSQAA